MIDIVITILSFNVLIVIFKFFHKFNIDNLQALIINYLIAGSCSLYFSQRHFSIAHVLKADWIFHAIAVGVLFITTFNFYAKGTQKVGIAITTIANKLSLFVPVGFALLLYPNEETLTFAKVFGFILAIAGIYFSATKRKKLSFDIRYLWLIIFVFAGQGIADTIFNHAQKTVVNDAEKGLFLMTLLFIASLSGVIMLLGKSIKKPKPLKVKNLVGGIVLGIPNYITLIFFFNSLESSGLAASQVFPVISMGIVAVSALVGLIFFKEKLTLFNWIGIAFALLSIYIITFV